MIRGRRQPPLTPDQRALRGNAGDHRKLERPNVFSPANAPALVRAPEGLSPVARAEYRRVGRLLRDARVISRLDRAALTIYAVAWANWLEAEAKAPGSASAHRWMTAVALRADALGLLPAGRTRIQTLPDPALKAADPIETLFQSRPGGRKAS